MNRWSFCYFYVLALQKAEEFLEKRKDAEQQNHAGKKTLATNDHYIVVIVVVKCWRWSGVFFFPIYWIDLCDPVAFHQQH